MRTDIINGILDLFDFILVFSIAIILLGVTLTLAIRKKEIQNKNIQLYGMFVGLTNKSILSLSISTLRFLFVLWCALGSKQIISIYLLVLILLSIIYHIINFSITEMIMDTFNSALIYFSLLMSGLLYNYVTELNFNILLLIISILLKILVLTYSTYFFFKTMNEVLKKNKKGI